MKSAREPVDHVRVCCRVRPLNTNEKQQHKDVCVNFPAGRTDSIECTTAVGQDQVINVTGSDGNHHHHNNNTNNGNYGGAGAGGAERHSFTFSHVFKPDAGQADVYDCVARPIVADVISGYNGTIFMYGQTGSGKTHTMFGDMKGGAWTSRGMHDDEEADECASTRASTMQAAEEEKEEAQQRNEAVPRRQVEMMCEEDACGNDTSSSGDDDDESISTANIDEGRQARTEGDEGFNRPSTATSIENYYARSSVSRLSTTRTTATSARAVSSKSVTAGVSTPFNPPPSSSSFCRTKATVTPLGELQQVNTLQTTAGMAERKQKLKPAKKGSHPFSLSPAPPSALPADGVARQKKMLAAKANNSAQLSGVSRHPHRAAFTRDTMSGVIPRAVQDIFQAIADADPSTEFDVQMFFVEVYMEQIRDLLVPSSTMHSTGTTGSNSSSGCGAASHGRHPARKLQLREDVSTNSFYIDGCRMPHVSSAQDVLQLVKTGLRYRATSATAMNETSSRSHCLLNLTVKSVNHTQCVSTVGKLYLVDLAGSEKVGKTNATGLRLEEAKLINKSLSTLGMVIMSLTDHTTTHTPYRNSVLTKILKDSLGGNSHTALVICCSPSAYNAQETLSTLRFGARAKAIENKAVVNRELTAAQLRRMLDSAKDEIERLHHRIRQLTSNGASQMSSAHGVTTLTDSLDTLASQLGDANGGVGFPAATRRKLSNGSVASSAADADYVDDLQRISTLLEEKASEQARLQQLRAEAAQLQDSVNAAQETISTLQEERDAYLDKIRSLQEEIHVWEAAHHHARDAAATQDALLQQCKVLLRTQSTEIKELLRAMAEYAVPIAQARAAVDTLNSSVFRSDMPSQRRCTMIGVDETVGGCCDRPVHTCRRSGTNPHSRPSGDGRGDINTLSVDAPPLRELADGESPNPRRQLVEELGDDVSLVLPQTSRSQQQQHNVHPHQQLQSAPGDAGRLSGTTQLGLSPAVTETAEWRLQNESVEPTRGSGGDADPAFYHGDDGQVSREAAQAHCILELEKQLASLSQDHATLQQQHKDLLAELQSKQRILDVRRSHLDNITGELRREYAVNRELRERLEKDRETVRAPLEMARNDANYWRRRYEELAAHRKETSLARSSETPRSSLRFVLPALTSSSTASAAERVSAALMPASAGVNSSISAACAATAKARVSFPGTPSRVTSCRGSGEEVLLSLSSHSTPTRMHSALPVFTQLGGDVMEGDRESALGRGDEGRVTSPLQMRSASRSASPSANSKL